MQKRLPRVLEAISVLVFFLQALRVAFSVLFGIIYDQIFEGPITFWLPVSNGLLVIALLAPILARRKGWPNQITACAIVTALARVALTVNDATVRYWASLIVLAAGGLYLAILLIRARPVALAGLIGSLALDQTLRAAGHTFDISLRAAWLPVQAAWAAALVLLAVWLRRQPAHEDKTTAGLTPLSGLTLGGWLFVETSLLALPNAVARWSDGPYPIIAPVLLGITSLPLLPPVHRLIHQIGRPRAARIAVTLALITGLLLGYFTGGVVATLALLLAQACAIVMLTHILDNTQPTPRPAGLVPGFILLLILNFANAFAFTYPYTLPAMRGLGWAVYLTAALLAGLGTLIPAPPTAEPSPSPIKWLPAASGSLAMIAVALVAVWPQPVTALPDTGRVRIGTYNIHYGYDDAWHLSLEWIAQTIEDSGADIVAMQEVDTGRMTSYGIDDAYYLARRLRMRVAYLPTVEHLTGIALLYRAPATLTDQALITSQQEQTGIVHVRVAVGGEPLDAYGIWLGLEDEDTQAQIREALSFIGENSPAVLGGDFNAELDSPVAQAIKQAGFSDPFVTLGIDPAPLTDPAINPTARIDFVWLRGLTPVDAWVPDSLASDHRMVLVEAERTP